MKNKTESIRKNQCLINGKWIGKPETPVINPASGDEIAQVPHFGTEETDRAINAANEAFKSWSKTLAKERSAILRQWFNLIVANADELAAILTEEQGKPLTEAKGEILYAASFVEFYAEEAKRIYGETIPSPFQDGRIVVIRQPIGVVAAITPWNFPAAMITRKAGAALAAGCTMVLKPSEQSPLNAIWEGSGNVIALDVLRALGKDPAARDTLLDALKAAKGADKS
mgnify:CR=1 FL=1